MSARTSASRLRREALEAFEVAARALGLGTSSSGAGSPVDLQLTVPGRDPVPIELHAMAIPSAERVRALVEHRHDAAIPVLVADQVPAPIRAVLNDAGIGWFDRRGHLRLAGDGVYLDADVPPASRGATGGASGAPIRGRSGLASAAGLLIRPDEPLGVSEIARVAGLNPSSVTRAMTSLVSAQLVERSGRGRYRALVPELFWALADVWPREHLTIRWATPPENDDRFDLRRGNLEKPGWAAAGVRGAVAWGAPIVATADFPIRLYAPSEQLVREVKLLHEDGTGDEAIISADPVGFVTGKRYRAGSLAWPVAHPLFCALDLTASSRDREALEQWTPPEEFTRVW